MTNKISGYDPYFKTHFSPFPENVNPTDVKVAKFWADLPGEKTCQMIDEKILSDRLTEAPKQFQQNSTSYSHLNKAFYPVVPANTQEITYGPVAGEFDQLRLQETPVLELINKIAPNFCKMYGVIYLKDMLPDLISKMGIITDETLENDLGSCALIAENLIIVARHAIENRSIDKLLVTFGYVEFQGIESFANRTKLDYVIEEDCLLDYAIVRLSEPLGKTLGFISLNFNAPSAQESALLHYPLGKSLRVSVHALACLTQDNFRQTVFHDSDSLSSGGAHFNPCGEMVAMHLGTVIEHEKMHLKRCALPLYEIAHKNPSSLICRFAREKFSQQKMYVAPQPKFYLESYSHDFLMDLEGYQSEKILHELLENTLKSDKKILLTKNKKISFSEKNLEYIKNTYPQKFSLFIKRCLNKSDAHAVTKQYSVKGYVDSDHTLPHDVWKSTTHPIMKPLIQGKGKRPGENILPAITIPHDKHVDLKTTGNGNDRQKFRRKLVSFCDNNRVDQALLRCLKDYKNQGIHLNANQITTMLDQYVDLQLLNQKDKKEILKKL